MSSDHRRDLRALERRLMADGFLEACHLAADEGDGGPIFAYVVPRGAVTPARFDAEWQRLLAAAGDGEPLPELVPVPVSGLPRDDDGGVDAAALVAVPVVDGDLASRWEEAIAASLAVSEVELDGSPEAVSEVVVVRGEHRPRELPFHIAELPGQGRPTRRKSDGETGPGEVDTRVDNAKTVGREGAGSATPAVADGGDLRPLAGEPVNLGEALQRAAQRPAPSGVVHLAADGTHVEQTYGELLAEAARGLAGLRSAGLESGDAVLLQVEASREFIPIFWACVLGGMVPVPVAVAPDYREEGAVTRKLLGALKMFPGAPVVAGSPRAKEVTAWAGRQSLATASMVLVAGELLAGEPAPEESFHRADGDDVTLILLTSGSTGQPKGVPLSHVNILSRSRATGERNGLGPADVSLNWMPLDHVGGVVMFHLRDVCLGCRQIHAPTEAVLREPLTWLDWVDRHRVTATWAPNFAYGLVNDHAEEVAAGSWDLSCLRFILNGGEAIVARTARRFLALLQPHGLPADAMTPAWGMSETSSGITYSLNFRLDSTSDEDPFVELGEPLAGTALRITGADGAVLAEGEIGRVQVRGTTVTQGYHRAPEKTAEVFTDDGWFDTGDLGMLQDGRLTLTGREKDVIIINGANYYSHEIEAVVEELPGVVTSYTAACAVTGEGGDGERLAVFLSPEAENWGERMELVRRVRQAVVRHVGLRPDHVLLLRPDQVPKTGIGKIQRSALRERFESGELAAERRAVEVREGGERTVPRWFHARVWRRHEATPAALAEIPRVVLAPTHHGALAVALDRSLPGPVLRVELASAGTGYAADGESRWRIDPANREHWELAAEAVAGALAGARPAEVVWVLPEGGPEESGVAALVPGLATALARWTGGDGEPVRLLALARGALAPVDLDAAVPKDGGEPPGSEIGLDSLTARAAEAAAVGLLATLESELPGLEVRAVDVAGEADGGLAEVIADELADPERTVTEAAWRGGRRYTPRLQAVEPMVAGGGSAGRDLPRRGAPYLVAGGLGEVGQRLAAWLLERHGARLLLVGRRAPDATAQGVLAELQRLGDVTFAACDVTDGAALETAVAAAEERWGAPLAGAYHLAATYRETPVGEETAEGLAAALAAKARGAVCLAALLDRRDGGSLVLFSSLVGTFPGAGIGAYVAANRFLDRFAVGLTAATGGRVSGRSLAWSTWRDVGLARQAGDEVESLRGFRPMAPEAALASLGAVLAGGEPLTLVGLDPLHPFLRHRLEGVRPLLELTAHVAGGDAALSELPAPPADRRGSPPPASLHRASELPRGDDGRVDRRALEAGAGGGAPESVTEKALAGLWSDLLGVAAVSRDDHFFALGGDSLDGSRLLRRLRREIGSELTLRDLFQAPRLRDLARRVDETGGATAPAAAASAVDASRLSRGQRALWVEQRLEPASWAYNVVFAARVRSALDPVAMERALSRLADRHPMLRTRYPEVEGEPVAVLADPGSVDLVVHDGPMAPEERTALATAEARRPFDLAEAAPFRAHLWMAGPDDHHLLLVSHHLAIDGWSLWLLLDELRALYAEEVGEPLPGALKLAPETTYADHVAAQEELLAGPRGDELVDHWRRRLAGAPARLELPRDFVPRPRATYGDSRFFRLDAGTASRVRQRASELETTTYLLLLGVFQVLLARTAGQEEVVTGTPVSGRPADGRFDDVAGYFVNPLPIRASLAGNPTFTAFLEELRATFLDASEHADLPFPTLVEALGVDGSRDGAPVFQSFFVLQRPQRLEDEGISSFLLAEPGIRLDFGALTLESVGVPQQEGQFDVTLQMIESRGGLSAQLGFDSERLAPETAEAMVDHFQTLLAAVLDNPAAGVFELPLLDAAEERRILAWDAVGDEPRDATLPELFAAQVERQPDAVAVRHGQDRLTYRQLANLAAAVAGRLAAPMEAAGKSAAGDVHRVALLLPEGPRLVAAMLGVLRAGGAFVCLDPAQPAPRLKRVLADASPAVLVLPAEDGSLAGGRVDTLLADLDRAPTVVELPAKPASTAAAPALQQVDPEAPAYVAFTSGSTGTPKGIVQSHASFVQFLRWQASAFGVGPGARWAQWAVATYDAAYCEIFGSLCFGAELALAEKEARHDPRRLLRWASAVGATHFQTVPSFFHEVLTVAEAEGGPGPLAGMEAVMLAGERLANDLAQRFFDLTGGAVPLYNLYGPTETVLATWHRVTPEEAARRPIPVGRAIAGRQILVLDAAGRPCPVGVRGEILVRSPHLTLGYLGRPDLTARSFVQNPLHDDHPDPAYRTGDLGRWRADGVLEFLGRRDGQVKVRGMRLELGEVEAALRRHPAVADAAAAVVEEAAGTSRLVAWWVAAHGDAADGVADAELRDHLARELPAFMVPSAVGRIDALPRTTTGKLDRAALPAPAFGRGALGGDYVEPEPGPETHMAALWADLLSVDRVGRHDDFFALGGHSLLANRLIHAVSGEFGVDVPLRALFEATTVAGFTRCVEAAREAGDLEAEELLSLLDEVETMSEDDVKTLLESANTLSGEAADGMDR